MLGWIQITAPDEFCRCRPVFRRTSVGKGMFPEQCIARVGKKLIKFPELRDARTEVTSQP